MEERIKFDYNNALAINVGTRLGITEEELYSYIKLTEKLHKRLEESRKDKKIGFYELPYQDVRDIEEKLGEYREKFDTQVVFGIGGSALGAIALMNALCHPFHNELPKEKRNGLRTYFTDNVDPDWTDGLMEIIDPEKTVFILISKSGSTAETSASFLAFYKRFQKYFGDDNYLRKHLIVITDPVKGDFRKFAKEKGLIAFDIPENVGGRFSVLSAVGLVPAFLMGIDIRKLLEGAKEMDEITSTPELLKNMAYLHAVIEYILYRKGANISVLMPYSNRLSKFADWYVQLWAESLGKKYSLDDTVVYVGPTPLKAVGSTDQHSQVQLFKEGPYDKIITFVRVEKFDKEIVFYDGLKEYKAFGYLGNHDMGELINAEEMATEVALAKEGKPSVTIIFPRINEKTVGQFIFHFEVKTAFAGLLFNVNAFDQPGVEEGKNYTYGLLGRSGYEGKLEEFKNFYDKRRGEFVI